MKQMNKKIQTVFSKSSNNTLTLQNSLISTENNDIWGDRMCKKGEDEFRIVLKQIGGLGVDVGNPKEIELKE